MNGSNPTLNPSVFSDQVRGGAQAMTLQGTINKTFIMLLLLCVPAAFVWQKAYAGGGSAMPWIAAGGILGFIVCMVTVFKREWAPVTAPVYAVCEGLLVGGISAMYEMQFHGIVMQAVMLTVGVLLGMLGLYTTRILQPTQKFMMGVVAATGAVMLVYLVGFILSLFGVHVGFLYGNGLFGIGFSIVVVVIAAMNLIIDFGVIEGGVAQRAPKYMEWYASFGLMVTLVWLYLEILRLLSKFASRRD